MRRAPLAAALLLLLALAPRASAAWLPVRCQNALELKVGETKPARMCVMWSGFSPSPWIDLVFESNNPGVAEARGVMKSSIPIEIPVTAIRPGEAAITQKNLSWPLVLIFVTCGDEPPIVSATPHVATLVGKPVSLRVETPIAHRTSFAWFYGRTGDRSTPLPGAGPELAWTPPTRGTHYVWVQATTPCSTTSSELRIDAQAPKQRAARR